MTTLPTDQARSRVGEFLARVRKPAPVRGNLVFALDATASRQPTWDAASHLQGQMFNEVASIGTLDVQTVFFRGSAHVDAECKSSNWLSDPIKLAAFMNGVVCRAGLTQWVRVFDHTLRETNQRKVHALVLVGDTVEEPRDHLLPLARRLADANVPVFAFHEGHDPEAEAAFKEIAQVTGGAYCKFDQSSSKQLGELLRAIAVFATGGRDALEAQGSAAARLLLGQIR
jgi:hypothetical protein